MPGRRKRSARHRARIEKFLGTKCLICFTPQETPSKPLPCCGYRIHEDCLLSCFRFAVGNMRDCCPHCRSPITSHNHGQPVPRGPNIFCFETVSYPPPSPPPPDWENEFTIFNFLEPDDMEELFLRASSYDPGYRDGSVSGMNFAVRSYGKFHPGYRDEKW